MNIIITGGYGFIGSALIKHLLDTTDHNIANIDKLAYSGNTHNLVGYESHVRLKSYQADICDVNSITKIFNEFCPDAIFNLAAESHVDRSISAPNPSIETNILGTVNLLECTRDYLSKQNLNKRKQFKFIQVSTCEVFGETGIEGRPFVESDTYQPGSPYSASKASANHLVSAWHRTYGVPTIITYASNNYGDCQFPEKLIPLMILKALRGEKLPIYGDGKQMRDWLHVSDHVSALCLLMDKGVVGESYNICSGLDISNLVLVEKICEILDNKLNKTVSLKKLITFVEDRPGHDFRHAIDSTKIQSDFAWSPQIALESGLERTIDYYLNNYS